MSDQRPDSSLGSAAIHNPQISDDGRRMVAAAHEQPGASPDGDATTPQATVLVRGETLRTPGETRATSGESAANDKTKAPQREVSESKARLQGRLPVLDDDADVGSQKEHIVIRDGKADLAFTGTLLASAAPASALKGQWQEYRIYETNGGKHVFSKTIRSVYADEHDTHEAEVFDPAPASVPSQLLRSARDLTRSQPLTWRDAAVEFFGYAPLAKALYRKLDARFEERID